MCRETGVQIWVQLLEGPPPKIRDSQKHPKIRRDFWQLYTLIATISGTDRLTKIKKQVINSYSSPSDVGLKKLSW